MVSSTMEERLQKLKQLQKKKAEASKQNREELFKEYRTKKIGENKLRSLEEKQSRAMDELERLESKEKGEDWDRKKAWDYSIEDHEKWDKKLEDKQANIGNAGHVNYSQLAEQSYKKHVKDSVPLKEEYLKQKATTAKSADTESDAGDGVDYNNRPSKESIDRLVSGIKSSDARKARRRNDYSSTDNYSKYTNYHLQVNIPVSIY